MHLFCYHITVIYYVFSMFEENIFWNHKYKEQKDGWLGVVECANLYRNIQDFHSKPIVSWGSLLNS